MQEETIYVPTTRYVHYNDQGEITSIGNNRDFTENCIEVDIKDVINFLTGKESASSYLIVYDTLVKKHVLKLKYHVDETAFCINDDIFKISNAVVQKPDLTITQDINSKNWRFSIDPGLKNYLQSQETINNRKIHFSITRKNDPHELYRLILVDFADLVNNNYVEIAFIYQNEASVDNLSVYTTKRFETYVHEVINDHQI